MTTYPDDHNPVTVRPATPEEEAAYAAHKPGEPFPVTGEPLHGPPAPDGITGNLRWEGELVRDPNRGHGLIDQVFPLRAPQTEGLKHDLDALRHQFITTARYVAQLTPDGPDQTLIIRDLHACMQRAVMTVVCGEENVALMNAKERAERESESR